MNIKTFAELRAALKLITEKGYSILLDDELANVSWRGDSISNEHTDLTEGYFAEGEYKILPGKEGAAFFLMPGRKDALRHWIDVFQYQRVRSLDLTTGSLEIEEMN